MAKKMYFKLSPENFALYSTISRDGDIKFRRAESFNVEDEFYNNLIFVAKRKKLKGRINIKEDVTGTKFILKIIPNKDNTSSIKIYSNKLELRTHGEIALSDILMTNRQASGFFRSFRPEFTEDEVLNERLIQEANKRRENYTANVLEFFAEARYAGRNFRNDVVHQDKDMQKCLRRLSRKLR